MAAVLIAVGFTAPARPAHALAYKLAHVMQPPGADYSFGGALAVDDTHVLVGADADIGGLGGGRGAAYLFDVATGELLTTFISPRRDGGFFAQAVALAGTRVIVGEPYASGATTPLPGSAWIFDASGPLLFELPNPTPAKALYFGFPLVVDGSQVWVASPYGSMFFSSRGALHLFDMATGDLIRTILQPDVIPAGGGFSATFATLGSELLVGAPWESADDHYGAAYVIDAVTGAVRLRLTDPSHPARRFATAVAASGGLLAVGANGDGVRQSAIQLFDATTGALLRTLENPFHLQDYLGNLAVDGTRLAAGMTQYSSPSAFVFDVTTGAVLATVMNPDPSSSLFGDAAAIHGRDLFVSGFTGVGNVKGAVFHFVDSCGDGVLDPCELCDDGNRTSGDGCDADCQLESCGNGVVDPGERCDDGNAVDGDGCDSNCLPTGCGDCIVTAGEECDDGNAIDGDGCDQGCVLTRCGNGITTAREECDDGNDLQGDGCTPGCVREACGNYRTDAGESCDDGNLVDGDGCSAQCRLETPRLDWLKPVFQFYVGDFNSYYGRQQLVVGPTTLLVSVHYEDGDTVATAFDRDGRLLGTLDQGYPGPLATYGADFLVGEERLDDVPTRRIHRYDGATLERRATYLDPTPAPPDGSDRFGFVVAGIGDKVLVRDEMDEAVYVFDADTGALLHALTAPPPADPTVFGRAIQALGNRALIAGAGAVHLFDVDAGTLVRTFVAPRRAHGPFGRIFVALGSDVLISGKGVVYLFDATTGDVRHVFAPPAGVKDTAFGFNVVIADGDVVVQGARGLYVFDAATYALRHVIAKPAARGPDQCFGFVMPAFDGHLVASDPCADVLDVDDGIIYLFAHDDGRLLTELVGQREYEDFFRPVGTYDATIVGRNENLDSGFMTGYRPCSDGVLEPGEECDDGNRTSGDGCDVNCTVSRCGNGIVGIDEECDDGNAIPDDGCEPDCRRTRVVCASGGELENVRLVIHNAGEPSGDESLTLIGTLRPVAPLASDFAPDLTGVQLVIEDTEGAVIFDLSARTHPIPPGEHGTGCAHGDGWRTNGGRFVYTNQSSALDPACTPGSSLGLRHLTLDATAAGRGVRFRATVPHGTIPIPSETVVMRLVVGGPAAGRAGSCGERTLACRRTSGGATVVCR